MKIAKPLLLVSTPLGMVTGLLEAYRLVGGLALAGIVTSLGKALYHMPGTSERSRLTA